MGEDSPIPKYVAEFIGTFMLVFSVGCNVLTGQAVWGVTSIACTLMVSIYALGGVSGANFNPAVSLALGLANKLAWKDVAIYIVVQLTAGVAAGFSYAAFFKNIFDLQPSPGYGFFQTLLAEFLYTFMLCFVVLNVAASKAHAGKNQFYGLAIGFVVIAGGYGAGHISGGCFNPAVAWGIDISSASMGVDWCFFYSAFEFLGAALASFLFKVCRPEEKDPDATEPPAEYPLGSRLMAEFLGTFFLVVTVGLNVIGGSKAPVFSIAASLMCMIFALGTCSGAHFNPAVTIAILCAGRGKISPPDAAAYIGVQLVGGMTGGMTYARMCASFGEAYKTFPLDPGAGYGWAEAAFAEIMFTFLLAFVVLSVATVESPLSEYFGLAIGSCVTAGGYAIGAVSGGSLNPAVSWAISFSHVLGGGHFWHCLVYSVFEIIGGCLAAGVFMATHRSEYEAKPQAASA